MADKMFVLSEQDRRVLLRLIAREKQRSARSFGSARENRPEDEEYPTPELYIALTPPGGINALTSDTGTGSGTGTGTTVGEGNTPGWATCTIYRVVRSGGVPNLKYLRKNQEVLNLSTSVIAGNTWVQVNKDKFGEWLVVPPTTISSPSTNLFPYITDYSASSTMTSPFKDITINKPATVEVGDYMVVVVQGIAASLTVPAGWTTIFSGVNNGTQRYWMGYRVVDGTEGASWTWTLPTGDSSAGGGLLVVRNVDTLVSATASDDTGTATQIHFSNYSSIPSFSVVIGLAAVYPSGTFNPQPNHAGWETVTSTFTVIYSRQASGYGAPGQTFIGSVSGPGTVKYGTALVALSSDLTP